MTPQPVIPPQGPRWLRVLFHWRWPIVFVLGVGIFVGGIVQNRSIREEQKITACVVRQALEVRYAQDAQHGRLSTEQQQQFRDAFEVLPKDCPPIITGAETPPPFGGSP